MPPAIPQTNHSTNTTFSVEGVGVSETWDNVDFNAELGITIHTDHRGIPNRYSIGDFEGTAKIEFDEYEADRLIDSLDPAPLGGFCTATKRSEPEGGETSEESWPLVCQAISGTWRKGEKNMKSMSFMLAGVPTINGKELVDTSRR